MTLQFNYRTLALLRIYGDSAPEKVKEGDPEVGGFIDGYEGRTISFSQKLSLRLSRQLPTYQKGVGVGRKERIKKDSLAELVLSGLPEGTVISGQVGNFVIERGYPVTTPITEPSSQPSL